MRLHNSAAYGIVTGSGPGAEEPREVEILIIITRVHYHPLEKNYDEPGKNETYQITESPSINFALHVKLHLRKIYFYKLSITGCSQNGGLCQPKFSIRNLFEP